MSIPPLAGSQCSHLRDLQKLGRWHLQGRCHSVSDMEFRDIPEVPGTRQFVANWDACRSPDSLDFALF